MEVTMSEDAAERRQQEEREARTAEIRRMLEQPGGQDEVAKQFGKNVLASPEFRAAQRQRNAAQAQRREAAEARARDAGQKVPQPGRTPTRQEMVAAQKSFQQTGQTAADLGRQRKQIQTQSM